MTRHNPEAALQLTTRTLVLIAAAGAASLGLVRFGLKQLPSQQARYSSAVVGGFSEHTDRSISPGQNLVCWSLDSGRYGTVTIGPFPAPDHIRFAVRGPAGGKGADVFLELEVTKDRIPVVAVSDGKGWKMVDVELPLGWRGWRITLNASSTSANKGGDIGISQPFGWGTGGLQEFGLVDSFIAWLANGLLYGAIFVLVAHWLAQRNLVEPFWVPLASAGALGLAAYVVFWGYFASPTAGKATSIGLMCAALGFGIMRNSPINGKDREWVFVTVLAVIIGAFYLAVLELFPAERDFYQLASNRFLVGLPGDNRLPFDFANDLYHGIRPKELGAGWLSSDRPPLQEGWQLIAWPITQALGFSSNNSSATSAVWFQLLWVLSLYGLLRSSGLGPVRAVSWTAVASLNGFFLLNTLFTWPKLCAGAYACGAYGMWLMAPQPTTTARKTVGGVFAALALLCHGGVAFSLIPLVFWAGWRLCRGEVRPWAAVALVILLALAPWIAYQRYFAPPGDRLLKWHLAGQHEVGTEPLLQTISNSYRRLSWGQIAAAKEANLAFQFGGDWSRSIGASSGGVSDRRADEFYHVGRAIGIWSLSFFLLAVTGLRASGRRRLATVPCLWGLLFWIAASMTLWCLLLYDGAMVHQGSYALMIAIFAFCALGMDAAGRYWLGLIAAVQSYGFFTTWWQGNALITGRESVSAVALALLACAAFGLWLRWAGSRFAEEAGRDIN